MLRRSADRGRLGEDRQRRRGKIAVGVGVTSTAPVETDQNTVTRLLAANPVPVTVTTEAGMVTV